LLLCSSSEDPRKEKSELEMLRSRQVDGIVVASEHGSGTTELLQQLTKQGTAIVMIDRDESSEREMPSRPHRTMNASASWRTSHLLDLGSRAIAHIGGPAIVHRQAP